MLDLALDSNSYSRRIRFINWGTSLGVTLKFLIFISHRNIIHQHHISNINIKRIHHTSRSYINITHQHHTVNIQSSLISTWLSTWLSTCINIHIPFQMMFLPFQPRIFGSRMEFRIDQLTGVHGRAMQEEARLTVPSGQGVATGDGEMVLFAGCYFTCKITIEPITYDNIW